MSYLFLSPPPDTASLIPSKVFRNGSGLVLGILMFTNELLEATFQEFQIIRYVSLATCILIFYDYILTIPQEVTLIWHAPSNFAKFSFLFYRYGTPASLILLLYTISGYAAGLNDSICRHLISSFSVLLVIFSCCVDAIAVLHVSALWRRNRKVLISLLGCYIVSVVAEMTCMIISATEIFPSVTYIMTFNLCTYSMKPIMLITPWVIGLFFDVVVLGFICWNAFKRQRLQGTHLVSELTNDGLGYFAVISVLRLLNLFLSALSPAWSVTLVLSISWPASWLNLSHFIFELRSRKRQENNVQLNHAQWEA